MRECRRCKKTKPLSDFHLNKSCSEGRTRTCRICEWDRRKAWYASKRKWRQQRSNELNQQRKQEMVDRFGGKCYDCQNIFPNCVFEFHHLDPTSKDVNPSKTLGWTKERRDRELSKCIMLCSNCHKIRHFVRPDMTDRLEVQDDAQEFTDTN